jgi:hypothetical protein
MADPVRWSSSEPTIGEILSDPIVRALMEADGVEPSELEAMLRRIAAIRAQSRPGRTAR